MDDRTLILTASVGCGHLRAAQAVQRAMVMERPGVAHEPPRIVDCLEHVSAPFRAAYRDGYLAMVRSAPAIVGHLYDRSDRPRGRLGRRLLGLIGAGGIPRMVRSLRPRLVVCTHFLPSAMVAEMRHTGEIDAELAIVVTDVDAHGVWLAEPAERYFVAGELARRKLISFGVDARRITVSGIPIEPEFAEHSPRPDRAALRRELGLDETRLMVLLSGGGFGVGPIAEMAEELLKLRREIELVAVAGRNRTAEAAMRALASRMPADHPTRFTVHGYTNAMRELMAAADLLVGKPGGLTSSEALASGLPMAIVAPLPGQEECNSDHLLELGVAIRCRDRGCLGWKVAELLDDRERLTAMRSRALASAKPGAARCIARTLLAVHEAPAPISFTAAVPA